MRFFRTILILISAFLLSACASGEPKPETPLDALKAYQQAVRKKDPTEMKLLLSKGSLKMADDEAKAQNTTIDEIIKRETLFTETQKTVRIRNQKIEGERATIEVENAFGSWDIVPFNKEDGEWKIAKERYVEEQMKKSDEEMRRLDEQFKQQQQQQQIPEMNSPGGYPTPMPPTSGAPDTTAPTP